MEMTPDSQPLLLSPDDPAKPGCLRRWWKARSKRGGVRKALQRLGDTAAALQSKNNALTRQAVTEESKAKDHLRAANDPQNTSQVKARAARAAALRALRRSKQFEARATAVAATRERLLELKDMLETAELNVSLHSIMQQGSQVADDLLARLNVQQVDDLILSISEQQERAQDVSSALGAPVDDDSALLMEELQELEDRLMLESAPVPPVAERKKTALPVVAPSVGQARLVEYG